MREAAARQVAAAEAIEEPRVFEPALRDDNWRVRRAAVDGLSRHAHRDMLASLLTALRDEHHDFNVLSSALTLLGRSDIDVTAPLIELLQGPDADLRMQAALALGEQQQPAAVGPLVAALDDPDANVRFHAIEALGRLRAPTPSSRSPTSPSRAISSSPFPRSTRSRGSATAASPPRWCRCWRATTSASR